MIATKGGQLLLGGTGAVGVCRDPFFTPAARWIPPRLWSSAESVKVVRGNSGGFAAGIKQGLQARTAGSGSEWLLTLGRSKQH